MQAIKPQLKENIMTNIITLSPSPVGIKDVINKLEEFKNNKENDNNNYLIILHIDQNSLNDFISFLEKLTTTTDNYLMLFTVSPPTVTPKPTSSRRLDDKDTGNNSTDKYGGGIPITPSIFQGLLLFWFMFVMLAFSTYCVMDIRAPSIFVTKCAPVGKES